MIVESLPSSPSPALAAMLGSDQSGRVGHELPPLWMMQVVQLDALAFEFTPAQIAVLFNVQAQEVRDHCRDLWGIQGNRWSLEFDQAAVVIYRMARSPRKVKPERVLEKLQTRGLNNSVILSHELVARARQAIQDDREERRKAQLTIKQRSGSA